MVLLECVDLSFLGQFIPNEDRGETNEDVGLDQTRKHIEIRVEHRRQSDAYEVELSDHRNGGREIGREGVHQSHDDAAGGQVSKQTQRHRDERSDGTKEVGDDEGRDRLDEAMEIGFDPIGFDLGALDQEEGDERQR